MPVGIRMAVVVVVFVAREGFVAQPTLDIDTLGRRVEEAEVEQQCRIDRTLGNPDDRGAWIEQSEPCLERLLRGRLGEVGLGQQQAVRHRRLLYRLGLSVERAGPVDRIDRRHDAIQHVARRHNRLSHQGVQDRRRIGEPGGLDRHTGEERDLAFDPVDEQIGQGVDDVIAHRAAEAPAVEQHDVLARPLDEEMVETDLAELVDDDRGRGHVGLFQHMIEHGRLAAAEKTGQQSYRDQ